MAIVSLTDEVLLEAYNLDQSPKSLANTFQMAESSIHYRLAKLRQRGLIPATAQPNQHTTQTPVTAPIIRDLMTGEVCAPKPVTPQVLQPVTPQAVMPPVETPNQMTLDDVMDEVFNTPEQTPEPVTLEQTPEPVTPEQTPAPVPLEQTPAPVTPIEERIVMHTQPKGDWESKIKALIPQKKPYIEREEDVHLSVSLEHGFNVILQGEAGTGKTRMVQYYAEKNDLPFLRVSCDDTSQLRTVLGSLHAANGSTYFKEGIMLELIKQPSVILFDEFNCLPSSRLFFLHEILDNRKVHIQELDQAFDIHPECRITLACNPNTPRYSGTNKVNAALADRCTTIVMPVLDKDFIKQFIKDDSRIQFFIELNQSMQHEQMRAAFSLRGAMRIEKLIADGMPIDKAYRICLLNGIRLTASDEQAKQVEQTARIVVKGWGA